VHDGLAACLSTIKPAGTSAKNGESPVEIRAVERKTLAPPPDLTARQQELWALFIKEKFWVPGHGEQTVWENTKDPASLCRKLGGDGFMDVDLDIIYRLSAWSFEKWGKARRNLGAFLRACFARDQAQAKTQIKLGASSTGAYRALDIPAETDGDPEARAEAAAKAGIGCGSGEVDDD
jgi:hypothetical protein